MSLDGNDATMYNSRLLMSLIMTVIMKFQLFLRLVFTDLFCDIITGSLLLL